MGNRRIFSLPSATSFSCFLLLLLLPTACYAQENKDSAQLEQVERDQAELANRRTLYPDVKEKKLELSETNKESTDDGASEVPPMEEGLSDAFVTSLSIILVSEIGDETFIIAALMAMRHPRAIVLSGALSALIIMTVLSTGLGRIVPNLISRKHTNAAATVLYTFFGARLLYIAWKADPNSTPQKELEEVEEKLEGPQKKSTVRRLLARFCTPIFLEAFILTFLAEWGDRSQIATIALASHKNAVGVTIGASIGHTVCTSLAVVGGRLLALRISQRTVAAVGGFLFLCFALSSYIYPPL
ncbi:Ca2+/H+ antiporter, TMEM165/GDT1 family [Marchantia polymorpha subsp. ruderalis]|uniref:GDT1 family protein n=1 Tax=Marchantia polymorpha TaxID=3197 RepID=A0A2R6X8C2_MARPO|nr:hypothetical protein MARPO_0030s0088 [Marchantia polymorpha]BBN20234.1 hypothetical protein Mp_8g17540 [Marchantia polymorpha subsp. ruderalis]|eukprot:PTQ42352.1 hypothetical protein MARPO_0030s0088 [Marchantia polymorpha]